MTPRNRINLRGVSVSVASEIRRLLCFIRVPQRPLIVFIPVFSYVSLVLFNDFSRFLRTAACPKGPSKPLWKE